MKRANWIASAVLLACPMLAAAADVKVNVSSALPIARTAETIELKWADVEAALPNVPADHINVIDSSGKDVVCQTIDEDGDGKSDLLIFQSDFAPNESKSFVLKGSLAARAVAAPKVYGRYVPERLDDWAWENDRTAFRIYGPALEKVEPGSSGVDAWVKNTREMVIDKWYKSAEGAGSDKMSYHKDHGEGLDGYKVGHGRGCGGTGVWIDGKMYDSGIKGWHTQKTIANGPIRLIFELGYEPWDCAGKMVAETKRITLDAGSNLNRFDSTFTVDKGDGPLQIAIGLTRRKQTGPTPGDVWTDQASGIIRYWDEVDTLVKTKNGSMGTAVVIDPKRIATIKTQDDHILLIANAEPGKPLTFWAGDGWDRSQDFKSMADWDAYLKDAAQRAASPLKVSIEK